MATAPLPVLSEQIGLRLREARRKAGLTGPELAQNLGISQSKISRIETGRVLPTADDVQLIGKALRMPAAERARMAGKAAQLGTEVSSWRLLHRAGVTPSQEEIAEIEALTTHIRIFHVTAVPGLLQTATYARHIIAAATGTSGDDLEDAVTTRLKRQEILHDPKRQFGFVMMESVLRIGVVPREVMAGQVDMLLALSKLPNVDIGVVPFGTALPVLPTNGFVLMDERAVVVETFTAEMTFTASADVQAHVNAFDSLMGVALRGKELIRFLRGLS